MVAGKAGAVFCVSHPLVSWVNNILKINQPSVQYLPNFIIPPALPDHIISLPGKKGKRVVCLANLRPEKDILTLIKAMLIVINKVPETTLFLIGSLENKKYVETIKKIISDFHLEKNISFLGFQDKVFPYLASCDIGVLSSEIEGFPVTLLEYGFANLAVVATNIGQCSEVLDNGLAGLLVPPKSPEKLSSAILTLIEIPDKRLDFGKKLSERVKTLYNSGNTVSKITGSYKTLLQPPGR
jgi:glycosyltransferase involved in cell wall biosynthesis